MASAEQLRIAHSIEGKVMGVDDRVQDVRDDVRDVAKKVQDVNDKVQDGVKDVGDKVQAVTFRNIYKATSPRDGRTLRNPPAELHLNCSPHNR